MSKFRVLIIVGVAVGVLGGGLVALFTSGNKTTAPAPASQPPPAAAPVAAPAGSMTNADRAAAFNEQGKTLMFAGKFGEATPLFREAVNLVPEPKYFFNLGTSLFQEGKFDEALTALNAVRLNDPTALQLEKSVRLRGKIVAECREQKVECHDPWPTEATPAPSPAQQKAVEPSTGSAKARGTMSPIDEAGRLNELAKTELYAGRFEAASGLFEQSLSVHPTPVAQFGLALADFQQGLFDKAIVLLKKVLASEPAGSSLNQKSGKLLARIRDECAKQKVQCIQ